MAKFPTFDPQSNEAISSVIAGLSNGISKLSSALNLQTQTIVDYPMEEIFIDSEDRFRLYQVAIDKKGWLDTPSPIIKKNGEEINPLADNFTINLLGGSIEFNSIRPQADDVLTVTATYITEYSTILDTISNSLSNITAKVNDYKGNFISIEELEQAVDVPQQGDYALILGTEFVFVAWDNENSVWKPLSEKFDLSNYYTKTEIDTELNKKEPNIAKQGETALSDDYYFGGRKTWIDGKTKFLSKSVYDTTGNGIVDNSEKLGGYPVGSNGKRNAIPLLKADGVTDIGQYLDFRLTEGGIVFRISVAGDGSKFIIEKATEISGNLYMIGDMYARNVARIGRTVRNGDVVNAAGTASVTSMYYQDKLE